MSITYPVFLPVPIKSDRFGLNINKSQFSGEFVRNRTAQSHGAGTTDRWEGVYTTPLLNPTQHREMSTFLNSMSIDDGTFFAFNPNHRELAGSYDDSNLLAVDADPEQSGTTTFFHFYASDPIFARFNLVSGDTISLTARVKSSTGADSIKLMIEYKDIDNIATGAASISNIVASATYLAATITGVVIPANTHSIIISVRNDTTTETGFVKQAILTKAATAGPFVPFLRIDGGGQTGRSINIKSAPTSINGLVRAGDYIQMGDQFHEFTERLDTDGSGLGTLEIIPAVRTAHADGLRLLLRRPVMIAQLVKTDHPQETNHNSVGVISFAWQEVV